MPEPTKRELELGLDLGTDVYGEGELGTELGTRIAELLAERREAAKREVQGLRNLIEPNAGVFWQGYVDGLEDALRLLKRAGQA